MPPNPIGVPTLSSLSDLKSSGETDGDSAASTFMSVFNWEIEKGRRGYSALVGVSAILSVGSPSLEPPPGEATLGDRLRFSVMVSSCFSRPNPPRENRVTGSTGDMIGPSEVSENPFELVFNVITLLPLSTSLIVL